MESSNQRTLEDFKEYNESDNDSDFILAQIFTFLNNLFNCHVQEDNENSFIQHTLLNEIATEKSCDRKPQFSRSHKFSCRGVNLVG